ncbi:Prolyl 4-hydroxylase 2 [Diplonema papillatum]|nr:Prolyl 4-hydroxylase 2 [Diplonema papillatum]|eukprot:gene6189-9476_t
MKPSPKGPRKSVYLLAGSGTLALCLFCLTTMTSGPLHRDWDGCADVAGNCAGRVGAGYCRTTREAMEADCRRSCGFCEPQHASCTDVDAAQCPGWAAVGECKRNPAFMATSCQRSCGFCVSCLVVTVPSTNTKAILRAGKDMVGGRPVFTNGHLWLSKVPTAENDDSGVWRWTLSEQPGTRVIARAGAAGEPYHSSLMGLWERRTSVGSFAPEPAIAIEECPAAIATRPARTGDAAIVASMTELPAELAAGGGGGGPPVAGVHYAADYDVFNPKPAPASYAYPADRPPAFLYPEDIPTRPDIPYYIVSHEPRVYYFPKFITDGEADDLRAAASLLVTRSAVVPSVGRKNTGIQDDRTSSGCWLDNDSPSVEKVRTRILLTTGFHRNETERLQILRYGPGQKYVSHVDYFYTINAETESEADEQWASKWDFNWNRAATFFMYLHDTESGGETAVPRANGGPPVTDPTDCSRGLRILPRKGSAMLFYDMKPNREQDPYSMHAGCPVAEGTKWAGAQWLHVKVRDKGSPISYW